MTETRWKFTIKISKGFLASYDRNAMKFTLKILIILRLRNIYEL